MDLDDFGLSVMARPFVIIALIQMASVMGASYIAIRRGQPLILGILWGVLAGPAGVIRMAVRPQTRLGQELDDLQAENKHASQTAACPNCGRMNSVLTTHCPRCDQKLEAKRLGQDKDAAACPNCGRMNSVHCGVCPRCETKLVSE